MANLWVLRVERDGSESTGNVCPTAETAHAEGLLMKSEDPTILRTYHGEWNARMTVDDAKIPEKLEKFPPSMQAEMARIDGLSSAERIAEVADAQAEYGELLAIIEKESEQLSVYEKLIAIAAIDCMLES